MIEFLVLIALIVGAAIGVVVMKFGISFIYDHNKKADSFIGWVYGSIIVLGIIFLITLNEWINSLNIYLRSGICVFILTLVAVSIIFMIATWHFAEKPSQKTDKDKEVLEIHFTGKNIKPILNEENKLAKIKLSRGTRVENIEEVLSLGETENVDIFKKKTTIQVYKYTVILHGISQSCSLVKALTISSLLNGVETEITFEY